MNAVMNNELKLRIVTLLYTASVAIRTTLKTQWFRIYMDPELKRAAGACSGTFGNHGFGCEVRIAPNRDLWVVARVLLHEIAHALKRFDDRILGEKVAEYVSCYILHGKDWGGWRASMSSWGNEYFGQDKRQSFIHTATWEEARVEGDKLMAEYKTLFEKLEECILEQL